MTEEEVIDDTAEQFADFDLADRGIRLGNNTVDTIGFLFLVFLHAQVFELFPGFIPEEGSPFLGIYFFVLYVSYHALFEQFLGKTPGKYLTRTHVVTITGEKPTLRTLLIRNACRLIPFDALSFLLTQRGLHDELSKTCVVHDQPKHEA